MKTFLLFLTGFLLTIIILLTPTLLTILFGLSIGIAYWLFDGSLHFYFQFDAFLMRIQIVWIVTLIIFFALNFFMYFYNKRNKL